MIIEGNHEQTNQVQKLLKTYSEWVYYDFFNGEGEQEDSLEVFAESKKLSVSDTEDLIFIGQKLQDGVEKVSKDERVNVKLESLGLGHSHNYVVEFEGERIGYALSVPGSFAVAYVYNLSRLAG